MTDPDPKVKRFFWLKGAAGTGKTTVAHTVASLARAWGLLGADFFFSRRGEAELRDPKRVFPTIAYQLARFDRDFCRAITSALERDPEARFATLPQQLTRLIVKPLRSLQQPRDRIVVVVFDAFDECAPDGAAEILTLLVEALPSLPFILRIFITGRPEPHIYSILVPSPNLHIAALHDIEDSIVKEDIRRYLTARLRGLANLPGFQDLLEDWITDAEIQILVDAAGTFFIHAATSIRFLMVGKGVTIRRLLNTLLSITQSSRPSPRLRKNPYEAVDKLYEQIVLTLTSQISSDILVEHFREVVGTIILLRDPLPVDALVRLTNLTVDDVTALLRVIQSVVRLPAPPDNCPRVYHPSFPDFLQDHDRCTDDHIWINTEEHEARITQSCLKVLNGTLHKNMLGSIDHSLPNKEVEGLEVKIKAAFLPDFCYACKHWATHLARVPHSHDHPIRDQMIIFVSRSLLPWLETMSWMGLTRAAVQCLETANRWVVSANAVPEL